jgi:hypothetical protein
MNAVRFSSSPSALPAGAGTSSRPSLRTEQRGAFFLRALASRYGGGGRWNAPTCRRRAVVARLVHTQEVAGSIPAAATSSQAKEPVAIPYQAHSMAGDMGGSSRRPVSRFTGSRCSADTASEAQCCSRVKSPHLPVETAPGLWVGGAFLGRSANVLPLIRSTRGASACVAGHHAAHSPSAASKSCDGQWRRFGVAFGAACKIAPTEQAAHLIDAPALLNGLHRPAALDLSAALRLRASALPRRAALHLPRAASLAGVGFLIAHPSAFAGE